MEFSKTALTYRTQHHAGAAGPRRPVGETAYHDCRRIEGLYSYPTGIITLLLHLLSSIIEPTLPQPEVAYQPLIPDIKHVTCKRIATLPRRLSLFPLLARRDLLSTSREKAWSRGSPGARWSSGRRRGHARTQICHGDRCRYRPATVCELTAVSEEPRGRSSPLSTERPPLHIPGEGLVARFSWGRHAQAQTQICHGDCCCYCPATVCELTAAGRERGATRGQVPLLLHEKGGGDVVEELYPPRAFPAMVREGPAVHDRPEQRWWKEQLSVPMCNPWFLRLLGMV
ncbi:uncharacterized protein LOC144112757 isoform X2 [Amblyomma americanum]